MEQCFFLPKEIMTEEYSRFSAETKLLFAMLLTSSKNSSAIMCLAELIEKVGDKEINSLQKELKKINSESGCA